MTTSYQALAIHNIDIWVAHSGAEYRGAFRARLRDVVVHEDDGSAAQPYASEAGARADVERRSADWNAAQAR